MFISQKKRPGKKLSRTVRSFTQTWLLTLMHGTAANFSSLLAVPLATSGQEWKDIPQTRTNGCGREVVVYPHLFWHQGTDKRPDGDFSFFWSKWDQWQSTIIMKHTVLLEVMLMQVQCKLYGKLMTGETLNLICYSEFAVLLVSSYCFITQTTVFVKKFCSDSACF